MTTLDPSARWGVEHRPIGSRTWLLLFTVASREFANTMLYRVCCSASGDFRLRHPKGGYVRG